MMTIGCMAPWLKKMSVGPAGISAETRDPADVTTELSEEGPAAFVEEASTVHKGELELSVDDMSAAARWEIANAAIGRLLRPEVGPLAECDLHLYMFDPDVDKLMPIFEREEGESDGWKPGVGATGVAWSTASYVLVTGSDTHNDTYGLDPSRQENYRNLTAVAATPVENAVGDVIAVLSASTKSQTHLLETTDAADEQLWLAFVMGRLLVDVLEWESD